MPIRINLLAEAQAAEELRRKDPVKRAALVAGALVTGVAAWSGTLQFQVLRSKRDMGQLEARWRSIEKDYLAVVEVNRRFGDAETKLAALQQLTTNRFLWGNALNALQTSLDKVDGVQFTRLRTEQSYVVATDKPKTPPAKGEAPKTGTATERIGLTIEAIDASPQPGSQVDKFKASLAAVPWFAANLNKTNGVLLHSLSAPTVSPVNRGTFVTFTLNCVFPERVR